MPENAVKQHYDEQSYESYFTENMMWRMVFGLLFWEELFCINDSQLFNNFERKPVNLLANKFYEDSKFTIKPKLKKFQNKKVLFRHLLNTFIKFYGKPNSIFLWKNCELDKIKHRIYNSSL